MDGIAVLFAAVAVLCLIALGVAWLVITMLKSRNKHLRDMIDSQNEAIDNLLATITKNW